MFKELPKQNIIFTQLLYVCCVKISNISTPITSIMSNLIDGFKAFILGPIGRKLNTFFINWFSNYKGASTSEKLTLSLLDTKYTLKLRN